MSPTSRHTYDRKAQSLTGKFYAAMNAIGLNVDDQVSIFELTSGRNSDNEPPYRLTDTYEQMLIALFTPSSLNIDTSGLVAITPEMSDSTIRFKPISARLVCQALSLPPLKEHEDLRGAATKHTHELLHHSNWSTFLAPLAQNTLCQNYS